MKRSIIITGPVLSRSGYGEQARFAVRCLDTRPDLFDVYVQNIPWGQSGWIDNSHPERENLDKKIRNLANKRSDFRADVSLQVTIPDEFKIYAPVNIGYTAAVETDRISKNWAVASNMMESLIVPSQHAQASLQRISKEGETQSETIPKVEVPISVVNYSHESRETEELDLSVVETEFNFLVVAQLSPRKDVYNSIKYFIEEFKSDPTAGLILKIHNRNCATKDRFDTLKKLREFVDDTAPERKCKIYMIHGDMTPDQMHSLYRNTKVNAFLTTSHGEGFGLPIFEAASAGLIVLSPDWGGQRDFLYAPRKRKQKGKLVIKNSPCFVKLPYKIAAVEPHARWPGVITEDSQWAYVTQEECQRIMRKVKENPKSYASAAKCLQGHLSNNFTFEKKSKEFVEAIMNSINKNNKGAIK